MQKYLIPYAVCVDANGRPISDMTPIHNDADPCAKCHCEFGALVCDREQCFPPKHERCIPIQRDDQCCPDYDCDSCK